MLFPVRSLCVQEVVLGRHSGVVNALTFEPLLGKSACTWADGSRVAVLWVLCPPVGLACVSAAFLPGVDGVVFSGGSDGTLRLWDPFVRDVKASCVALLGVVRVDGVVYLAVTGQEAPFTVVPHCLSSATAVHGNLLETVPGK